MLRFWSPGQKLVTPSWQLTQRHHQLRRFATETSFGHQNSRCQQGEQDELDTNVREFRPRKPQPKVQDPSRQKPDSRKRPSKNKHAASFEDKEPFTKEYAASCKKSNKFRRRHKPSMDSAASSQDYEASGSGSKASSNNVQKHKLQLEIPYDLISNFKTDAQRDEAVADASIQPPKKEDEPLSNAVKKKRRRPAAKLKPALIPRYMSRKTGPNCSSLGPNATNLEKIRRSIYKEWGYIRHQHAEDEVLPARRAFKKWKIQYHHVLDPVNPDSWPWRDKGKWLFELPNSDDIQSEWESLDVDSRKEMWPHVMLSTMHLRPERAATVLAATMNPLPPGYAIHDVVLFLVNRLNFETMSRHKNKMLRAEEMLLIINRCLKEMPAGHVRFQQRTFGLLCQKLPLELAGELYAVLNECNHPLHFNTKLQFASKLARGTVHKDTAFDLLRELVDGGTDINDIRISSAITMLLFQQPGCAQPADKSPEFSPKKFLEYFVERGLSPTVGVATATLNTLCQQDKVEEAMQLALLFLGCGVEFNSRTWTTLFRGAKDSLVADNIARALEVAIAANAMHVDVLNNVLHSVFYFANMESRQQRRATLWHSPLFPHILRLYVSKFDLDALRDWLPKTLPWYLKQGPHVAQQQQQQRQKQEEQYGQLKQQLEQQQKEQEKPEQQHLVGGEMNDTFNSKEAAKNAPASDDLKDVATSIAVPLKRRWMFEDSIMPVAHEFYSSSTSPILQPTPTTLSIVLRCFIRSLRAADLVSYYELFTTRLEKLHAQRIPPPFVTHLPSLIHDTFIMVMMEHSFLARAALRVFGDMLRENATTDTNTTNTNTTTTAPNHNTPLHPAPTMFTYNIILKGLFRRRDGHALAESVIGLMRLHGIQADRKTWNILIRGYANRQDVSSVVAALHDMEAAGFSPDVFTYSGFGRLHDQKRAMDMMEEALENLRRL
ncbi:hypothetical protein CDD81_4992 [Ophiocordyceps australis]|uniref:Pentacotripeptide-repeat region of PRORP domain-containing protein n=1 Tax=Ophiocordyceps australis TaxID=1399860 RepID=A0A2C5Y5Z6_9HYPO|nr:hypothetical protein CDD81_4992 [Ophiocordyceps australis]